MSCTRRFLFFRWDRHAWDRRVALTTDWSARGTDMWSRAIPVDQVLCHTQYVCRTCGAVRDGTECGCDKAVADKCAVRLALLAEARGQESGPRSVETGH
jgi:hypothetical protein